MNTDRHLLFGLLAVQLRRITEEQLTEACVQFSEGQGDSLAGILAERGWLAASDRTEIEHLMGEEIDSHDGDVQTAMDTTISTELIESIASQLPQDLTETLTQSFDSLPQPLPADTVELSSVLDPEGQRDRYELLHIRGEGGLGRVWVARDQSLGRRVALKEIRDPETASPDTLARFIREARITSRLEHPNIVPVYDWIGGESETMSYTMRLLQGHTFADAINTYHKMKEQGAADRLNLQELLTSFIGICQAMSYAHARGVIHRDIKPANVLLGEFGEVILLDWGLAKARDDRDITGSSNDTTDDTTQTQMGDIMGTPAFMSPEQARGETDQVDHSSDIYSLGATLFFLLCHRSPHRGKSTRDVLRNISTQNTPDPREFDPTVPAPLAAICQKALGKTQADRYASVIQLRDDLQRWIADEPVSVYQESITEKTMRWARRNRGLSVGVLVGLVGVATVATIAAFWIHQAKQRESRALASEKQARIDERDARTQAEDRRQQALAAVSSWQVDLSDVLALHPRIQRTRERLLSQAADQYQKLSPNLKSDPFAMREYARIQMKLGDARRNLGRENEALSAYETAAETLEAMTKADTVSDRTWIALAQCQGAMAEVYQTIGKIEQAESQCEYALELLEKIEKKSPANVEYVIALTQLKTRLSRIAIDQNQFERATTVLDQALAFANLDAETRWNTEVTILRANALQTRAEIALQQSDVPAALAGILEAIPLWEHLIQKDSESPRPLEGLANSRTFQANAYRELGNARLEVETYQKALADYESLQAAFPEIPHYRHQRVIARVNLAQVIHRNGKNQNAHDLGMAALQEIVGLVEQFPNHTGYHRTEAAARSLLGQIFRELGQFENAKLVFQTAATKREQLFESTPAEKLPLAITLANLGDVLSHLGDHKSAEELFESADVLFEDLKKSPDLKAKATRLQATAWFRRGDQFWWAGDRTTARAMYQKTESLLESLPDTTAANRERAFFWLFCPDDRFHSPAEAKELTEKLSRSQPDNGRFQSLQGISWLLSNDAKNAVAVLENATQHADGDTALTWLHFALACQKTQNSDFAQSAYNTAMALLQENHAGNRRLRAIAQRIALQIPAEPARAE